MNRTLNTAFLVAATALLALVACDDGPSEALPPDVEPEVVDDGKADFVSRNFVDYRSKMGLNDQVSGTVDRPFRYHGYELWLEAGQVITVAVETDKRGKVRFYGPATGVARDGRRLYGGAIVKAQTEPHDVAELSIEASETGTYLIAVGPKLSWSASYIIRTTWEGPATGPGGEPDDSVDAREDEDFDTLKGLFVDGSVRLDDRVSADLGVHLRHAAGAGSAIQRFDSLGALAQAHHAGGIGPVLTDLHAELRTALEAGQPTFDCDAGFSADGGFAEPVSAVVQLSDEMIFMNSLYPNTYDDEAIGAAQASEREIEARVVLTGSGAVLSFGRLFSSDVQSWTWHLIAIDVAAFECGV